MAIILNIQAGTEKKVKNLGWLMRHAALVTLIEITPQHWYRNQKKGYDVRLTATLNDGRKFITDYASLNVLRDWLKRPSLKLGVWNRPSRFAHATIKDYTQRAA